MDAPLLTAKKHGGDEESQVWSEVKKQQHLAVPLVAGHLLVNVVEMVSIMFVGHIGKLELAGASIAIAFTTVTGFGLLVIDCVHSCKCACWSLLRCYAL